MDANIQLSISYSVSLLLNAVIMAAACHQLLPGSTDWVSTYWCMPLVHAVMNQPRYEWLLRCGSVVNVQQLQITNVMIRTAAYLTAILLNRTPHNWLVRVDMAYGSTTAIKRWFCKRPRRLTYSPIVASPPQFMPHSQYPHQISLLNRGEEC